MTRTELKVVLKLHHDWKINYRKDYATLLMVYPDGKILSMFEALAAAAITYYHGYNLFNHEINWYQVYREVVHRMSLQAEDSIKMREYCDTDSFKFIMPEE